MTLKILFAVIASVCVVVSLYADYRWRKWVAARRQERDRERRA